MIHSQRISRTVLVLTSCVLSATGGCAAVDEPYESTLVRPERSVRAFDEPGDEPASISNLQAVGWRELESATGAYRVRYRTLPDPIPMNELFDIEVEVLMKDGAAPQGNLSLLVDGRMPHHRHGMFYTPIVSRQADGRFLVEGMLFHMPGRWELHLDLRFGRVVERTQDVIFID